MTLAPPPARYATIRRRVCLVLMPRILAADASVRLRDKTSARISMRCNSFPLIVKNPNLRLRHLTEG